MPACRNPLFRFSMGVVLSAVTATAGLAAERACSSPTGILAAKCHHCFRRSSGVVTATELCNLHWYSIATASPGGSGNPPEEATRPTGCS